MQANVQDILEQMACVEGGKGGRTIAMENEVIVGWPFP